ncbi:hypothetical protein [Jiangella gansuensis]|uniref:hypothetical protein n=1 Tax=Jiangella gansuensis TaxID=281473 RepID=UPI0004AFD11E|nr:hypothetical protein [Jiangella gansuensis]
MHVTKVSVAAGVLSAAALLAAAGAGAAPAMAGVHTTSQVESPTAVAVGGELPVGTPPSGVNAAAGATVVEPTVPRESSCGRVPPARHREWLDGFRIRWLPPGLGPLVSDFEYEWDDVGFASRVWETGPDEDGAYGVDLQVTVMRSATLTDTAALHAFLTEYHERDPGDWTPEPFQHPDGPGFRTGTELFWLAEPGVAVRVHGDGQRFSSDDLTRTACDVRQVRAG